MITFHVEHINTIWDEIYPLAARHAQESRPTEPFLPSRERYTRYAECGYYHIVTARDAGRLVGYFGFYLAPSMHSQRLHISGDSLYLDPSVRGGRTALRLIRYVEQYVHHLPTREYDWCKITLTVDPIMHRAAKRLLHHLDYRPDCVQYSKRLLLPTGANSTMTSAVGTHALTT